MSLDYSVKYQPKIVERFKKGPLTNRGAGNDYIFTGARSIKVYSMPTADMADYGRGSTRFGTVSDAQYTTQEMVCSQAKSFTRHFEALDSADIAPGKVAGQFLRMQIDEKINPMLDKYRLKKWVMGAGTLKQMAAAPTKGTIVGDIMALKGAMGDNLVGDENLTLYISNTYYILLKQADAVVALEGMGTKSLEKGTVGTFDGMSVVPVPSTWLPNGVYFVIKAPHSTVDPVKLAKYDMIEKAVGYSGPVIQGLVYFDSFVMGERNVGIGVAGSSSAVLNAATVTVTTHVATVGAVTGVTWYYTDDGTDPRWSDTREAFPAAGVTLTSGMTDLRIIGEKDGCVTLEKTQAYE